MVFTTGIIGKTGFIGSNLEGEPAQKDKFYDVLINANGNSKKYLPETDPLKDFDLTVRNNLEFITTYKYGVYVYLSSCEVYHDDTDENTIIDPSKISRYALSKYLAECLVKKYCNDWLILRINGPYGKNLKKGPLFDILKGERLWVAAESQFQFMNVSYINKFIKIALERRLLNDTYNLAGNNKIALKSILDALERKIAAPSKPIIDQNIKIDKANAILEMPKSAEVIHEIKFGLF